jgi:phospholipase A1
LSYHLESFQLGFSHQSNGESGRRSRSWDRLFAGITLANDDVYWRAKIWYRIPESEKEFIDDATGDDNPDIESFIGRSEFVFGRRMGKFGIETTVRNNLSVNKNRGSVLLNVTYPVTDRYDVLLQYFNGYGDSLIDFNRHQQRIGLGIQLNFI